MGPLHPSNLGATGFASNITHLLLQHFAVGFWLEDDAHSRRVPRTAGERLLTRLVPCRRCYPRLQHIHQCMPARRGRLYALGERLSRRAESNRDAWRNRTATRYHLETRQQRNHVCCFSNANALVGRNRFLILLRQSSFHRCTLAVFEPNSARTAAHQ